LAASEVPVLNNYQGIIRKSSY